MTIQFRRETFENINIMKTITVREFARMYDGLELLTHTNASLQLGDLFDKKGMFNNYLDFSGYNVSYKLGLSPEGAGDLKNRLRMVDAVHGEFAGISIKDEFSVHGDMIIPSVNVNLSGKVEQSRVKYFEIGQIQTKILRDRLRYEIQMLIEDLIDRDRREYRQELRDLYIAEALYYSPDIRIVVEKGTEVDTEAAFGEVYGEMEMGYDSEKNQVFTIKGSGYPFAVDLKKIKHFM